jgi:hypothetical protein
VFGRRGGERLPLASVVRKDHVFEGEIARIPPPLTIVSQYLPLEYRAIQAKQLHAEPRAMIEFHIRAVLRSYTAACGKCNSVSGAVTAMKQRQQLGCATRDL